MNAIPQKKRLAIIGLDCAEPSLVFEQFTRDLPHLGALRREGIWGRLQTTIPPITIPAWLCMVTGRDPGELGIYGFRNRGDYSYTTQKLAFADQADAPRLWDRLGQVGLKSIIIGVPPSWPPQSLNGWLVSCFLTPDLASGFTYPSNLATEVEAVAGEYILDVADFRSKDGTRILEQLYRMTEQRFRVARHLAASREWDFLMMVDMGIDRIHHAFWHFMDPNHVLHVDDPRFRDAIRDFYRFVDGQVGDLLATLGPETAVLVVSDHGARAMDGGFCLNEWLIQEGYLALSAYPDQPMPFSRLSVDWSRTWAWGEGGYYGRVFLNVMGREPEGIIPEGQYELVRNEIARKLEAATDEHGRPLGNRIFKPGDVYRACKGVAPDLIVYFGDLAWRSLGTVGHGTLWRYENDTGPDGANHSPEGIFIARGLPGVDSGLRHDISVYDVAPMVLQFFGLSATEKPQRGNGASVSRMRND